MNKQAFVVVGIGTGVGKTLASAILCKALDAAYWKPIQTGWLSGEGDSDTRDVVALTGCKSYPEAYLFNEPLSPHAAAKIDGAEIDESLIKIPEHDGILIIEGAGGLMVPLNHRTLYIDLLAQWKLPVILVLRHYLGNINHTLLSLEALKSRNIPIAGLIEQGDPLPDTMEAIHQFGGIKTLLSIPELTAIDSNVIDTYAKQMLPRAAWTH
jgi:dethiobiotin synthetase